MIMVIILNVYMSRVMENIDIELFLCFIYICIENIFFDLGLVVFFMIKLGI